MVPGRRKPEQVPAVLAGAGHVPRVSDAPLSGAPCAVPPPSPLPWKSSFSFKKEGCWARAWGVCAHVGEEEEILRDRTERWP